MRATSSSVMHIWLGGNLLLQASAVVLICASLRLCLPRNLHRMNSIPITHNITTPPAAIPTITPTLMFITVSRSRLWAVTIFVVSRSSNIGKSVQKSRWQLDRGKVHALRKKQCKLTIRIGKAGNFRNAEHQQQERGTKQEGRVKHSTGKRWNSWSYTNG